MNASQTIKMYLKGQLLQDEDALVKDIPIWADQNMTIIDEKVQLICDICI